MTTDTIIGYIPVKDTSASYNYIVTCSNEEVYVNASSSITLSGSTSGTSYIPLRLNYTELTTSAVGTNNVEFSWEVYASTVTFTTDPGTGVITPSGGDVPLETFTTSVPLHTMSKGLSIDYPTTMDYDWYEGLSNNASEPYYYDVRIEPTTKSPLLYKDNSGETLAGSFLNEGYYTKGTSLTSIIENAALMDGSASRISLSTDLIDSDFNKTQDLSYNMGVTSTSGGTIHNQRDIELVDIEDGFYKFSFTASYDAPAGLTIAEHFSTESYDASASNINFPNMAVYVVSSNNNENITDILDYEHIATEYRVNGNLITGSHSDESNTASTRRFSTKYEAGLQVTEPGILLRSTGIVLPMFDMQSGVIGTDDTSVNIEFILKIPENFYNSNIRLRFQPKKIVYHDELVQVQVHDFPLEANLWSSYTSSGTSIINQVSYTRGFEYSNIFFSNLAGVRLNFLVPEFLKGINLTDASNTTFSGDSDDLTSDYEVSFPTLTRSRTAIYTEDTDYSRFVLRFEIDSTKVKDCVSYPEAAYSGTLGIDYISYGESTATSKPVTLSVVKIPANSTALTFSNLKRLDTDSDQLDNTANMLLGATTVPPGEPASYNFNAVIDLPGVNLDTSAKYNLTVTRPDSLSLPTKVFKNVTAEDVTKIKFSLVGAEVSTLTEADHTITMSVAIEEVDNTCFPSFSDSFSFTLKIHGSADPSFSVSPLDDLKYEAMQHVLTFPFVTPDAYNITVKNTTPSLTFYSPFTIPVPGTTLQEVLDKSSGADKLETNSIYSFPGLTTSPSKNLINPDVTTSYGVVDNGDLIFDSTQEIYLTYDGLSNGISRFPTVYFCFYMDDPGLDINQMIYNQILTVHFSVSYYAHLGPLMWSSVLTKEIPSLMYPRGGMNPATANGMTWEMTGEIMNSGARRLSKLDRVTFRFKLLDADLVGKMKVRLLDSTTPPPLISVPPKASVEVSVATPSWLKSIDNLTVTSSKTISLELNKAVATQEAIGEQLDVTKFKLENGSTDSQEEDIKTDLNVFGIVPSTPKIVAYPTSGHDLQWYESQEFGPILQKESTQILVKNISDPDSSTFTADNVIGEKAPTLGEMFGNLVIDERSGHTLGRSARTHGASGPIEGDSISFRDFKDIDNDSHDETGGNVPHHYPNVQSLDPGDKVIAFDLAPYTYSDIIGPLPNFTFYVYMVDGSDILSLDTKEMERGIYHQRRITYIAGKTRYGKSMSDYSDPYNTYYKESSLNQPKASCYTTKGISFKAVPKKDLLPPIATNDVSRAYESRVAGELIVYKEFYDERMRVKLVIDDGSIPCSLPTIPTVTVEVTTPDWLKDISDFELTNGLLDKTLTLAIDPTTASNPLNYVAPDKYTGEVTLKPYRTDSEGVKTYGTTVVIPITMTMYLFPDPLSAELPSPITWKRKIPLYKNSTDLTLENLHSDDPKPTLNVNIKVPKWVKPLANANIALTNDIPSKVVTMNVIKSEADKFPANTTTTGDVVELTYTFTF
jgi:hypothetical protein